MILTWANDWLWGLCLTVLTIMFHAAAIIGATVPLAATARIVQRRSPSRVVSFLLATLVVGAVGLFLAAMHGIESIVWAIAYLRLGALPDFASAIFYSVDSLAARGATGVKLAPSWRLMGALEAANGLLLFGMSTAFLAVIVGETRNRLFRVRPGAAPSA